MIKEFQKIDENGIIIETVLINIEEEEIPENCIEGWGNIPMYRPKWDFEKGEWIDTLATSSLLEMEKSNKDIELNEACRVDILKGFDYSINGVTYWFSYDMEAQGNFRDAKDILRDGVVDSIPWTVKTGGIDGEYGRIEIDFKTIQDISMKIVHHKTGMIARYRDILMPIVQSATTIDEVRAVKW